MRLLGAEVRPVHAGTATLKDATSEAIRDWVTNVESTHYILGSAGDLVYQVTNTPVYHSYQVTNTPNMPYQISHGDVNHKSIYSLLEFLSTD